MDKKKRNFIKAGSAAGGLAAFAAGYSDVAKHAVDGVLYGTSGKKTKHAIYGNALEPEFVIDDKGQLSTNPKQRVAQTMCYGCWTLCGVRVRIDNENESIIRIAGNPYHPLSAFPHLPYATSIENAHLSLGRKDDVGIAQRSTACARGSAMLENMSSPNRVLTPLKRVGGRGEGRWEPISFEKLVDEVVNGGDLFGEGHVDGLAAIRDLKTPVDENNPEYGAKVNQLLMSNAGNEGRDNFFKRFALNSYGTRNFGHHGSYCGFSFRAGSGAAMNDMDKYSHSKPDWKYVDFGLFIGTSPAQSGNPFKRQGRQLATARSERDFSYVVVSPVLPASSNLASQPKNNWVPIKPGSDSALAMGMIRWIIESKRYDKEFLTACNDTAVEKTTAGAWSNATFLVISDKKHPRNGAFLRASDLLSEDDKKMADTESKNKEDAYIVVDSNTEQLKENTQTDKATLFVEQIVETRQGAVVVKSSMQRLKEEANRFTLQEYSQLCDVPKNIIVGLAKKFTSYGRRAAVDTHGGTMSSNGFYTAYSIVMLNTLIGNYNMKGGSSINGGQFPAFGKGPRYNFKQFAGKVKPKGVFLSRSRFPYQKTSEYKRKVASGKSPYPSQEPWYPFSAPLLTEHLSSGIDGYPYKIKAFINNMANPFYGQAGLRALLEDKIKDPGQLPLHIAIDAFINETSTYADYIVPDTIVYEGWGIVGTWAGVPTKVSTVRWPVVEPKVDKTPEGEPICMESFLIAVAKKMSLPGFGDKAIPDAQGNLTPLNTAADFYLKAAANIAWFKGKPLPDISQQDIDLSGIERLKPYLEKSLNSEEQAKVAYILARGGRFEDESKGYDEDKMARRYTRELCIWNEKVGTSINSTSGHYFMGCPTYYPQQLSDGTRFEEIYPSEQWPFLLSSYKSIIQSGSSITSNRLRGFHGFNTLGINRQDAEKLGLQNGEKIRLKTPGGQITGIAQIRDGISRGTIGIEHGFGHRELGVRTHHIGDKVMLGEPKVGAGVNLNDIGLIDPHRKTATLLDWAVGSSARQALPAQIERLS